VEDAKIAARTANDGRPLDTGETMAATQRSTELSWYLDQIKGDPLLSAEEERELAYRIRELSDPMARETMIRSNLRLVVKIARQYAHTGVNMTDLIAEGNLGLLRAVEEFDPEAGVRFSTYAAWWIKQSLKKALVNGERPVHVPDYMAKLVTRWRRASSELETTLGRSPTHEEVAEKLHLSKKKLQMIDQGLSATSSKGLAGGGEDDDFGLAEIYADEDGDSPDQHLMDESNRPIVNQLLSMLDERKQKILKLRFNLDGFEGPQRTYKEIGEILNLTRERVRQLEREALGQIKDLAEKLA
jgi:RNA polymerase primary sigma factor